MIPSQCEYIDESDGKRCTDNRRFAISYSDPDDPHIEIIYYCQFHKNVFIETEKPDGVINFNYRDLESNINEHVKIENISDDLAQLCQQVVKLQSDMWGITNDVLVHNMIYIAQKCENIDFGYRFDSDKMQNPISRQLMADLKEHPKLLKRYIEKPNQKITDFTNKLTQYNLGWLTNVVEILNTKDCFFPNKSFSECIELLEKTLLQISTTMISPENFLFTIKDMEKLGLIKLNKEVTK